MTALTTLTRPRIGLKRNRTAPTRTEFDVFMESRGFHNDQQKADALGLTRTVVLKTRTEFQVPSSEFIAAVRATFPTIPYSRFFEETTEPLRTTRTPRSRNADL